MTDQEKAVLAKIVAKQRRMQQLAEEIKKLELKYEKLLYETHKKNFG